MQITGSKLYDYIVCPHRVWRDVYGPQDEKGNVSQFVKMLWEKGVQHETKVVGDMEVLDLTKGTHEERFEATKQAMKEGADWIYQGVLMHDNLLGIPDLLKKMPDDHYIPVDVKSGMGLEGVDEETENGGRPKKHYAVQLALYVEILKNLGFAEKNRAKVIDIHGNEIDYHLDQQIGKLTPYSYWEFYQQIKYEVQKLLENREQNKPALAGTCKLCPWYQSCKHWVQETHDLTNIFYLGRSKRDVINEDLGLERVEDMLSLDLEDINERKKKNKKFLSGVGEKTLQKLAIRADIFANNKGPAIYGDIEFPEVTYELFFDIEDDPTQEFVYLHGVYERNNDTGKERFLDFTATAVTPEAEKEAWAKFWDYIHSLPRNDYAVYYYSPHEKTVYKKMQRQYPDVISKEEVDDFFDSPNIIDLYQIILKQTDWPLSSYSIKAIAVYLGFSWRDSDPGGANSIEWYNSYLKTGDQKLLQRILDYNEDDCKATLVVKDGVQRLAALTTKA